VHSPEPASGADWASALARWARTQLVAGREDLHAQVREQVDQTLLQAALDHTGGHRGQAATLLGLGRNTIGRKLGPGRKRR
jgi:two-component system nitrogen regulation response regulator GlnG